MSGARSLTLSSQDPLLRRRLVCRLASGKAKCHCPGGAPSDVMNLHSRLWVSALHSQAHFQCWRGLAEARARYQVSGDCLNNCWP